MLKSEAQGVLAAAFGAIEAGQLAQAEALCQQLLAAQPAHGGATFALARIRRLAGDLDRAAALAEEAARAMPKDPAPRLEAALAHAAAGRFAPAEVAARKALRLNPRFVPGLLVLAEVLNGAGKPGEALAAAQRAAALEPRSSDARTTVGNILASLGRMEEAEKTLRDAAALAPGNPMIRLNLSSALRLSGRLNEAIVECDVALAIAGEGFVPALRLKGALLTEAREPDKSVEVLTRAAQLAAEDYETRFACGNALFDAQRFEGAITEFEAAGRLRPELTEADYNRARALLNLERLEEAEPLLLGCIEREPRKADAYKTLAMIYGAQNRISRVFEICNLGIERCERPWGLWEFKAGWSLVMRRTEETLACYARALEATPQTDPDGYVQYRTGYALTLLTLGRLAEGWREMRARWDRDELARRYPNFAIDPSTLPRDLSGKRVLIAPEQGLGDELFFLRFAPGLKERGATLLYQGEPKMHALLAGRRDLFGRLLAPDETPGMVDLSLLSGDLPEATGGEVAPPLPLVPDAGLLEAWSTRLSGLGPAPYIGVTWNAGLAADQSFRMRRPRQVKQVPVELLGAALREVRGTVLVLQRNPAPHSIESFAHALGRPVHDLSVLNERLDEMLAMLKLLDDYVCVSNANAHFAASVGRRCRVLVTRWPEWRWTASGEISPWFPGFRLYRQPPEGDWADALCSLKSDLLSNQ